MRTSRRLRPAVATLLAALTLASVSATSATAQPPVYKDAERIGRVGHPSQRPPEVVVEVDQDCCTRPHGYHRPVNSGPGYVGSVRGLGRPSYDGLWPPPGYGSYREHPLD